MLITSVNNNKIKDLVRLKDKKYRDKTGLFFVEGIDLVEEAYKSNNLITLYILEGYDNIFDISNVVYISLDVMKKISDMESISPYYGVCKKIDNKKIGNKLIILDNIQDPGNLGTIIRSAVAFNFDTVILSQDSVDLYNPKVLRSSKGMIFQIDILVADLPSFIDSLQGYTIYGTSVSNGEDIKKLTIPSKSAFLIGNEGRGISKELTDLCDKFIYIRMNDKCESLNAGVSAAIIMYEVMNK